jgi:hypothetical protein
LSSDSRIWPALLIAAMLVGVACGAMLIGAGNEPDEPNLPTDTYMMLTYGVSGVSNGNEVNGSFGVKLMNSHDGGIYEASAFNITGNIDGFALLPVTTIHSKYYLDSIRMETVWGEKEVRRFIDGSMPWPESECICISYRGTYTNLAYRVDMKAPEVDVTYRLTGLNITGMEDLDLRADNDIGWLRDLRYVNGEAGGMFNGGGSWGLFEPRDGEDLRFNLTANDYTMLIFDEDDIWNMVNGGEYQFNEGWSVMDHGNGSFLVEDQMVWVYVYSTEDGPTPTAHLIITVVEE